MSLYLQAVAAVEAQKEPSVRALKDAMETARRIHLDQRTKNTRKALARAERAYTKELHDYVFGEGRGLRWASLCARKG